jgi:uncharacterized SAM-binding protein YcdF (DUF218 family)
VVAGAPALPDGRPSGALARRVRLAVALWREGVAPRLVFTGGPGPGGHTEAGVAAALAGSLGVPGEAIVVEDVSLSTEDNARLSAGKLDARPVLVVSDSYHVLRCRLVFRRHFPAAHAVGAPPPPLPRVKMALREVVVLLIYAAQGRLHR